MVVELSSSLPVSAGLHVLSVLSSTCRTATTARNIRSRSQGHTRVSSNAVARVVDVGTISGDYLLCQKDNQEGPLRTLHQRKFHASVLGAVLISLLEGSSCESVESAKLKPYLGGRGQ